VPAPATRKQASCVPCCRPLPLLQCVCLPPCYHHHGYNWTIQSHVSSAATLQGLRSERLREGSIAAALLRSGEVDGRGAVLQHPNSSPTTPACPHTESWQRVRFALLGRIPAPVAGHCRCRTSANPSILTATAAAARWRGGRRRLQLLVAGSSGVQAHASDTAYCAYSILHHPFPLGWRSTLTCDERPAVHEQLHRR
jgi:hypothetical protein